MARSGMKADILVFQLDNLKVLQPEYVNDLPQGAPRWIQGVDGYEYIMCSGVMTYIYGQATGGAIPFSFSLGLHWFLLTA